MFVGVETIPLPGAAELACQTYTAVTLRAGVIADAWRSVVARVVEAGGVVTSAGGRRSLSANVTRWRSPTSLHYLGRAVDLALTSGFQRPAVDPFLITRDGELRWRVWARVMAGAGEARRLNVVGAYYSGPITAHVLDFTALAAAYGFYPIPCRKTCWPQPFGANYGGTEWWHFQYLPGLEPHVTTFGAELQYVWTLAQLAGTPPWAHRSKLYRKDWS